MAEQNSGGQDPRHPKSTYDAKYPMNRVQVTESGHEIHYDDTPGKERIREAHRTGSYREISPDGKLTQLTVANKIDYTKGGSTVTVDKNYDRKIGGSERIDVDGDSHQETKGTRSQAISGHHKMTVGEDYVTAVKGDKVQGIAGKHVTKVGGNANTKVDGKSHTIIDGEAKYEHGEEVMFSAEKKITFKVGGAKITMEPSQIKLEVGGSQIIITDGIISTIGTTHVGVDSHGGGNKKVEIVTDIPAKQTYSIQ